jgi:hypothetical protein
VVLEAFWSHWAWPLATSILGFVFTGLVVAQWATRRRAHQAAWSLGLLFYAVAAFMEFWSSYLGRWNPDVYRVYIVLAASLVGFLGLGTLYLLTRKRVWGHAYLAFNLVCLVVFFAGTFTTTLDLTKLQPGITVGGQALGSSLSFPRVMSFPFNIPGSIFLIGGALLSVWRFARKREFAYRMWANVLIALAAIIIAFVGSRARLGQTAGLYPAEMVASCLLLAGFLTAGTLRKGREAVRAGRRVRPVDQAPEDSRRLAGGVPAIGAAGGAQGGVAPTRSSPASDAPTASLPSEEGSTAPPPAGGRSTDGPSEAVESKISPAPGDRWSV